jgi:hypothetical protein
MTELEAFYCGPAFSGGPVPIPIEIVGMNIAREDVDRWLAAGSVPVQDQAELAAALLATLTAALTP